MLVKTLFIYDEKNVLSSKNIILTIYGFHRILHEKSKKLGK